MRLPHCQDGPVAWAPRLRRKSFISCAGGQLVHVSCRSGIAASHSPTPPEGPLVDGVSESGLASQVIRGRSLVEPFYHPKTHGIPAAVIHLRSYHPSLLDLFTHFVSHSASALAIPISRPTGLPTQRSLWTVPKGPFIHKKSQENFDRKTHKRVVKAWDTDPEVVERWVRYMELHSMAGVGMRVVRWERAPVSVGKKILESVKGELRGVETATTKSKVQELGQKIVEQELAVAKDIPELALKQ